MHDIFLLSFQFLTCIFFVTFKSENTGTFMYSVCVASADKNKQR
jgi:hypothetical protein